MNRLRALVCTLLAALPLSLSALTWTDAKGIVWSYTVSNGEATITGIPKDTAGAVTVPAALPDGSTTCPVTVIGDRAFLGTSLTSVVIPESVTTIGIEAFCACESLSSVDIPVGVVTIKDWAFYSCSSLTSVIIPKGVTSIEQSAFQYCKSLTTVIFPEGLTSIGEYSFYACESLTSVSLPEGLISIGRAAFCGCSLTFVDMPASVASVESLAFLSPCVVNLLGPPPAITNDSFDFALATYPVEYEEAYLEAFGAAATGNAINLWTDPETNIKWAYTVLENQAYIKRTASLYQYPSNLIIPETINRIPVVKISVNAFSNHTELISISVPEGVTTVDDRAFSGCTSLTVVDFPESVTSIGDRAFSGCTSLTRLTIPQNVTYLGEAPFPGLNCKIIFLGYPPNGLSSIRWNDHIEYPSAYAEDWEHALLLARRLGGYNTTATVSVRAEMTTPKTMKVTYTVNSPFSRAKVRAVAWKDGVRSFANIIPVKTAAEGSLEAVPNGESVTTGVEHTFVWQVAADWNIDLAKVAVEVLVEEAGLLPQDLVTIPATETHAKMTITTNVPTTEQLFNALIWHYAEGDEALVVTGGVMKVNGTAIANGARLPDAEDWNGSYHLPTDGDYRLWSTAWKANATALLNYLYGKMGFKVLEGADLSYAREATEIGLPVSGELDQVSVKISEE